MLCAREKNYIEEKEIKKYLTADPLTLLVYLRKYTICVYALFIFYYIPISVYKIYRQLKLLSGLYPKTVNCGNNYIIIYNGKKSLINSASVLTRM